MHVELHCDYTCERSYLSILINRQARADGCQARFAEVVIAGTLEQFRPCMKFSRVATLASRLRSLLARQVSH